MKSGVAKWISPALIVGLCAPVAWAQAPQTEVTPGEVIGVEVIRLEGDGGVAAGATMGGLIGLTYGRSRDHSRAVTRRRAALGAVAGSRLARRAGAGAQEAMEYTIRKLSGETVRFVTDQDDIRMADCVVIETSGGTANLRRVSDLMCLDESQAVVRDMRAELVEEADKCAEAKRALLAAETDEEIDRAVIRVSVLCDD